MVIRGNMLQIYPFVLLWILIILMILILSCSIDDKELSPQTVIKELSLACIWPILLAGGVLWGLISMPRCIIRNKWELIRIRHKQVRLPQNDPILEAALQEVDELLKTN